MIVADFYGSSSLTGGATVLVEPEGAIGDSK
jgi:hypothetical protein